MYVLDTTVVSELRRPTKANKGVAAWANSVLAPAMFLSAVTILELEQGILLLERRDYLQGAGLRMWLEMQVLPAYRNRVFPVDIAVARCGAALRVPDPRPERDALIAATALVHGMSVVTRNVADFAPMGVRTINPWAS